jgi:hypothetical protein
VSAGSSTGTKLRIDADREFEGQPGDSVLRVQGQTPDGGQTIFDAAYVEMDATEAGVTAKVLRLLRKPDPAVTDEIAQDMLAAFGSKLTARDAHQIAEICARSWRDQIGREWPDDERGPRIDKLAERFERASAQRKTPAFAGAGNGAQN